MEFNGSELKIKAHAAAQAALFRACQRVAKESLNIVPKDTGRLARSQYVSVSSQEDLLAEVGYTAEYAAAVHEGKKGSEKFLQTPFNELNNECLDIIKSGIEEAIG